LPCGKSPGHITTKEKWAELHLFDTGHFALEDKGDEIAVLMRDFLDRKISRK
jgi:hypothetical protein